MNGKSITDEFKEPFLIRAYPIRKPANLSAMNDVSFLLVQHVGPSVGGEAFEGGLNLFGCPPITLFDASFGRSGRINMAHVFPSG